MLVLTRKPLESIVVSGKDSGKHMLTVTVLEVSGSKVRLGFDGDPNVSVLRQEIWERNAGRVPPGQTAECSAVGKGELDRWDNEGGGPAAPAASPAESGSLSASGGDLGKRSGD